MRAAEEALRAVNRQGGNGQQQVVINGSGGEKKSGVNHILHLVLTIITGGLWGLVWLFLVLTNK